MWSLYHPSPHRGGEENGKKKGKKLVGQDKGSLTEQQTKPKVTTTIQIRRTYKTNCEMQRATLTARCPAPPKPRLPSPRQLPHRSPA